MDVDTRGGRASADPRPVPGAMEAEVIRNAIEAKLFRRAIEPTRVEQFVLLGTAGSGAMGIVYRAYDPELQREVALKLVRPELVVGEGGAAPRAMARLMAEARAAARVTHPNVAVVHQVGMVSDAVFIAMEFVDGLTLRQWCERQDRGQWRDIVRMFIAAGEGLAAAHRAGIIHRDFKPDNVLVGTDDRPRVTDFGLAVADAQPTTERTPLSSEDSADTAQAQTDAARGTPAYMSPEHHRGTGISEASDQFSYCVALWEALSGTRPYAGETRHALHRAVSHGTRRTFAERGTPRALVAALTRGLDPDPSRRFGSMDALVHELRRIARPRNLTAPALMVAAAGLTAAGIWSIANRNEAPPCDDGAARVAEVWNDARRHTVLGAFQRSGQQFATTSATRTAEILEGYAEQWVTGYHQVCGETWSREKRAPREHDPAMACLSNELTAVDAFVAELMDPDATTLARAVPGAASLPPVAQCLRTKHLPASPPDTNPGRATALAQVYAEIARARGLLLAGRFERALDVARQAAFSASELDDAAAQAVAWHFVGHRLGVMGKPEAIPLLEHAFQAALQAGDELQAAQVAIAMIQTSYKHAKHAEETEVWSGRARALIARVDDEPLLEVDRLQQMGETALAQGDAKSAEVNFQAAAQLARDHTLGPTSVAAITTRLAKAQAASGTWDLAERNAQAALAMLVAQVGPHHPRIAEIDNLLGTIAAYQRKPTAYQHFADAVAILDATDPGSDSTAGAHANLGTVARTLGRMDLARKELQHARSLFERSAGPDHRAIPGIVVGLARLSFEEGDLSTARSLFTQAFEHPDGGYKDVALEGLAAIHESDGDFVSAIAKLEQVVEIREGYGRAAEAVHARVSIAQLQLKLGRFDDAVASATEALRALGTAAVEDQLSVGRAHAVVGFSRAEQGRPAEAIAALRKALAAWVEPWQPPAAEIAPVKVALTRAEIASRGP